jgi:predicted permease
MGRDIRYAIQALWRTRTFTIAATITLGLAIGANATIFGLVDGLWLRPPGVPRAGELTRVFATTATADTGVWSYPEYEEISQVAAFSGVVAKGSRGALVHEDAASPDLVLVNVVSINFFSVLGVRPAHGRLFAPGDEHALEARSGVVLGHAFWQRRYGGDPSVVGRTIKLGRSGNVPVTVLAVLPRSFRDLDPSGDRDLWLPPATWIRLTNRTEFTQRDNRWFSIVARRRDARVLSAQAELSALTAAMAREFPAISEGRGVRVVSDRRYRLERGGVSARALLGLVLLVVLITCVNVANLMLARAAARTREIATRVALGAGRWRVMRQMLVESAVLGALGAAAGLAIATWLIRVLPAILPQPPGFPAMFVFQVDVRVLTFTFAVTVLTTMLFGLLPSWIASRGDVATLIKGSSALAGSRRANRYARQAFVVGQIAVSLVLLSAAGVLARSSAATQTADIGIVRKPILTAWSSMEISAQAAADTVPRLEALPGAEHVAVAIRAPMSLSGGGLARGVFLPHAPPQGGEGLPEVKFNAVSTNYFATLGTRVLRGRGFTDEDQRPGEPVIVVNQAFVDQFFGGGDAIDRTVRLRAADGPIHRIVGVVENSVVVQIDDKDKPYFFLPYWRGRYGEITYFIETAGNPGNLAAPVRESRRQRTPASNRAG